MWSGPGVFKLPNLEDALRFILIVNDIVGLSLAFIGLRVAYVILGTVFAISILFNLVVTLAESHATRLKIKRGEPVCPNIPALAIEIVGATGFLILYIVATIDTVANEGYWGGEGASITYVHAYCGMSGLIAW